MAEVTVSELAKSIGASNERLLAQMKEAGLNHKSAKDIVSDTEKQTLLLYLKGLHGESTQEPKKIVLKRKKLGTLKAGSAAAKKTVSVEVRKKRTYIKREEEPVVEEDLEPVEVLVAKSEQPEPVVVAVEEVEESVVEAAESESEPATAAKEDVFDPEKIRIMALVNRRAAQTAEKKELEALAEAKKLKAEQVKLDREAAAKAKDTKVEKKTSKTFGTDAPSADKARNVFAKTITADTAIPTKKRRGSGRAKVKTEFENKDWSKHSYRPQDFSLNEDADFEREELAKARAEEVAKLRAKNVHTFTKPTVTKILTVELSEEISVSDLAVKMAVKSNVLLKKLMAMGVMATLNESIDQDTATLLVEEMGHTVKLVKKEDIADKLVDEVKSKVQGTQNARAPIVAVMGHVDHGKTSLLDYIRDSTVAKGEAGGITQHIGAYKVGTKHGEITFLDTPGHAAFTAMRARGAVCTDIVILVVAADDGVMPQTIEAVTHSRAAGVQLIVAVNKMDKEGADSERVKNELSQHDVIPEDWGGDVQFVPVSAHTGEGIDTLLESISLQAELLELTATDDGPATGVVVESRMEKGKGAVCTTLIQSGTLRRGDILLAGDAFGRVRAMLDDKGSAVTEAGPSSPVEILGLDIAPDAGDDFLVVTDERKAREVANFRKDQEREQRQARQKKANLESMFASMGDGKGKKILTVVLKSDVRGSTEAIQSSLLDLGNDEVGVNVISASVGGINESDVNLALTTGAIVLGFNVRADGGARKLSEKESVEIRYYSIIYQLIDEVKAALSGMLDPDVKEVIVGIAEVRDVFRSPKFGSIAGSMVTEGMVSRSKPIRVLRENVVIYEGELESLRRFKDDVSEVRNGTECGIGVKNYTDVQPGDQIEVFDVVKVERTL